MTYIIAEIAQAHDGSLGILHSYIDALANTGINAIKFQTHIAEAESSPFEEFRVKFSYQDKTRYDYWKRMEFTLEQWVGIKKHCNERGLEFLSSPFSIAAVELLEKVGITKYKIGSGEVTNYLMLEKIARTQKPIILSSGMSTMSELEDAFNFIKYYGNQVSILQCNTEYPTPPEHVGLNVIKELKAKFNVPVGLSDHSGTIYPSIAAVALGAEILEFHAVFDKRMFGPDTTSSLTIDQISDLVTGVRMIKKSVDSPIDKNDNSRFGALKKIFEKSLAVNRDMKKGEVIAFEDLESKKPSGMGIPASEFRKIIGAKLNKDLEKYSFIKESDIE